MPKAATAGFGILSGFDGAFCAGVDPTLRDHFIPTLRG